jgi:hypothetical protein
MRYRDFRLAEGYKEVTQKFSQSADPEAVKKTVNQFRDLVNRNQVQGNERNIDWWGKQGWDRFQQFVDVKSQQQSQTQQKKRANQGESHTIDETPEWLIVVPLDKDASCFHGKDTDWCTTKPTANYFHQYFRDSAITLIYFLQKQTGRKWAIAVRDDGEAEFFDQQDQHLDQEDFDRQTKLQSQVYIDHVAPGTEVDSKASAARDKMSNEQQKLEKLIRNYGKLDSGENDLQIETLLLRVKDPGLLRQYLKHLTDRGRVKAELDQNMQTLIANSAPDKIYTIGNITDKTVRTAIKLDHKNIRYIENPSLEIVKYSVDQGGDWVFYNEIENPRPEVIEWVVSQNPYIIHSYLSKDITPQALQIATKAFIEEENENLYRDLLKWFRSLKDSDKDRLMDEEFYSWAADAWDGKKQELAVSAILHNIFLTRRIGQYRRWAVNELVSRFPSAREFLSDLGVKLD